MPALETKSSQAPQRPPSTGSLIVGVTVILAAALAIAWTATSGTGLTVSVQDGSRPLCAYGQSHRGEYPPPVSRTDVVGWANAVASNSYPGGEVQSAWNEATGDANATAFAPVAPTHYAFLTLCAGLSSDEQLTDQAVFDATRSAPQDETVTADSLTQVIVASWTPTPSDTPSPTPTQVLPYTAALEEPTQSGALVPSGVVYWSQGSRWRFMGDGSFLQLEAAEPSSAEDLWEQAHVDPSGQWLAVTSVRGEIGIWDLASGRLVNRLPVLTPHKVVVAWWPERAGTLLATDEMRAMAAPRNAWLWDVTSGISHTLAVESDTLRDIALGPDGHTLALLDGDQIVVVDRDAGEPTAFALADLGLPAIRDGSLDWTPDGRGLGLYLAPEDAALAEGMRWWVTVDLETRSTTQVRIPDGLDQSGSDLTLLPDGSALYVQAVGIAGGTVTGRILPDGTATNWDGQPLWMGSDGTLRPVDQSGVLMDARTQTVVRAVLPADAIVLGWIMAPATPTPAATEVPGNNPELTGSRWQLASLDGRPLLADTSITLHFRDEVVIVGSAGCNLYGSDSEETALWTRDGTFSIGIPAQTAQDCPQPDGIMAQEAAYMEALIAATRYALTGDTLTLLDASGAERLVFVRE